MITQQIKNGMVTFDSSVELYIEKKDIPHNGALHIHSFFELEVTIDGSGATRINNELMPLSRGSVYIVRPSEVHQVTADAPLKLYNFCFSSDLIDENALSKILYNPSPIFLNLDDEDLKTTITLIELIKSYHESKKNPEFLKKLTEALFFIILQNMSDEGNSKKEHIIMDVLQYIHENLTENISLNKLAAVYGYSVSYFSKFFVKRMGINFKDYITKARIGLACRLMQQNKLSPTEACYETGFQSYTSFSRAFKQYIGVSPRAYYQEIDSYNSFPD